MGTPPRGGAIRSVKRKSLIFFSFGASRLLIFFRCNSSVEKKIENVWHTIYAFVVMRPTPKKKSYAIYAKKNELRFF